MGRRSSKQNEALIIIAVVVGIPLLLISKLVDLIGGQLVIILFVLIVMLFIWLFKHLNKKRKLRLLEKYQNEQIVDLIMKGNFWEGQTEEQLLDSLGSPQDIDQKVLKTKRKAIWKYQHESGNRYRLRITIENGLVVGWEQR